MLFLGFFFFIFLIIIRSYKTFIWVQLLFQISLETKSGPIQTMAIHDVTRFYHNDLIVADSCGIMTVFCNQQILCRKSVAKDSINYLQVEQDKSKYIFLVTLNIHL